MDVFTSTFSVYLRLALGLDYLVGLDTVVKLKMLATLVIILSSGVFSVIKKLIMVVWLERL